MGDKGGDDIWVGTAKSSINNHTIPSGKDDSGGKARKRKKVQFEYEASKENGMFSAKSSGKVDKGKTGVKKTVVKKDTSPLELNVEEEIPKSVKCMMDCEAAGILDGIKDQMVHLYLDATIKLPKSFDMALEYAKDTSRFAEPQSVMQALKILRKHGASESEICMIANLCPEASDEVFGLVPSLKAKKSRLAEPLKAALSELTKLKTKQESPLL